MKKTNNFRVPRITQIDSKYLDEEIFAILKSTFSSAYQYEYVGQKFVIKLQPEFETLIRLFLYHFTLGKNGQTVGQQLLQIKYNSEISSKSVQRYYLLLIFASLFKQRIGLISPFTENKYKLFVKIVDFCETTYQCINIFNLYCFLIRGKFPTFLERLFNLNVVPVDKDLVRKISYAYFTRELLWNGFTDLLATTLPLIPANKFHTLFVNLLPYISKVGNDSETSEADRKETHCVICDELVILPHKYGCIHVVCYYCIYTAINFTPFRCPGCGLKVKSLTEITPL